ncbi:MAG TPA: glycoside hydrolase family 38 C-terminal domain-containing protein [Anaerolineaceae bacterium]
MPLTPEWQNRIQRWQDVLWQCCYLPLDKIVLSGHTTFEHLSPEQALQREFIPIQPGAAWGRIWEYGWFRGAVTLPPQAGGKRIVLRALQGFESLVWMDGKVAGSFGPAHKEITLTRCGRPGEHYEFLMEAYAGHPVVVAGGPTPFGVPKPSETWAFNGGLNESTFGIWLEEVYQLAVDFTTLYELREGLEPLSLRVAEVDQGLMDATMIVDVELPEAELVESARQARARLKPLLECTNGSTAPTLYAFGHAHIDVAWLWPLAETNRKIARTAINQLALIAEYPEYQYLQSTPELFERLKHNYPELYARFKAAVASGSVIPDGAMWLEADTNLSGGESLVRQVMLGRRYFKEEFGLDSRVLWLPDVFGYSGALPQILRGCGCVGFATQKITWNYNGGEPFPYNTFLWEGIDGTSIPAHIYTDYTSQTRPSALFARWNTRLQGNGIRSMILAYGWGDGGGGPDRNHLEFLRRAADLEGLPRIKRSSPAEFFADMEKEGLPRERYVGELYFQAHRGTFTSQAKTKLGMRRCEIALREAELWGVAARALDGFDFGPATLAEAWHKVLLNQFHDILPGSSIHRVMEEAEAGLAEAEAAAEAVAQQAAAALVEEGSGGFTVFNSLPWPRTGLIEGVGALGQVEVTVPPCGWTSINLSPLAPEAEGQAPSSQPMARAEAEGFFLENDQIVVKFNGRGEITSLVDKGSGRQFMSGPGNQFRLFKDVPDFWDAWDIASMAEQQPVAIDEPVTLQVLESGPLTASLSLTRKLHTSSLSQVIRLRRGSRRVEFDTTVDWHENHKLLKVAFPCNIHSSEVISEIQFGHLRRPTHRSTIFDADRFEICNHKWSALAEESCGVALLNDCKYGLSALGNLLSLTLLKSSLAPDPTADRGLQTFTYALFPWEGSLGESGVVRQAYELNVPLLVVPGSAGERSLFSLDAANIVIEAVKPAEDGSGGVVLRLYEAMRSSTRCTLTTTLPVGQAFQADMMETPLHELECMGGKIKLEFHPFEIITILLK